jgi:hypothetical protein
VTLTGVTADRNSGDNLSIRDVPTVNVSGGSYNNSVRGKGIEVLGVSGTVEIGQLGASDNRLANVDIDLVAGLTTLDGVTANGSKRKSNLFFNNSMGLNISGGSFSGALQDRGIKIQDALGDITLDQVTASGNQNDNLKVERGISVTVVGGSFNNSQQAGIVILQARGAVTLAGVTANGNAGANFRAVDPDSVTLIGGSFSSSTNGPGIRILDVKRDVMVTDVIANGNRGHNLILDNAPGGGFYISGGAFSNSVEGHGMKIIDAANVLVTNVTVLGNVGHGMKLVNIDSATVVGGLFANNGGCGIKLVNVNNFTPIDVTVTGNAGGDICGWIQGQPGSGGTDTDEAEEAGLPGSASCECTSRVGRAFKPAIATTRSGISDSLRRRDRITPAPRATLFQDEWDAENLISWLRASDSDDSNVHVDTIVAEWKSDHSRAGRLDNSRGMDSETPCPTEARDLFFAGVGVLECGDSSPLCQPARFPRQDASKRATAHSVGSGVLEEGCL